MNTPGEMNIKSPDLDWLLEPENPSMRYRALTELLGVSKHDPQAQTARAALLESKPVQQIFAKMHPDGYWLHRGLCRGELCHERFDALRAGLPGRAGVRPRG